MALRVVFTVEGEQDVKALPVVIRRRVQTVVERLAAWPDVSGAKAMRGALAAPSAFAPATTGSSSR